MKKKGLFWNIDNENVYLMNGIADGTRTDILRSTDVVEVPEFEFEPLRLIREYDNIAPTPAKIKRHVYKRAATTNIFVLKRE